MLDIALLPPAYERWLRLELPASSKEALEIVEQLRCPFNGFWLAAGEPRGLSLLHDEGTRLRRRSSLFLTPRAVSIFGIVFRGFGGVEAEQPSVGLEKMRVVGGDPNIVMAGERARQVTLEPFRWHSV